MGLNLKQDANNSPKDFGIYTPAYYNEISGCPIAGMVLGRTHYWWEKHKKKEFFMSLQRFASQLGMSRQKVRTAVAKLVELGFINTESRQRGYAPKITHWVFCEEAVFTKVSSYKAKRNIEAIKKATSRLADEKLNGSAQPTVGYQQPMVGCHQPTDGCEQPTYNNIYNINLNSSSSCPPTASPPLAASERKEEESNNKYYGKSEKADNPPSPANNENAIRPVDIKVISGRMLELWNRLCPVAKTESSTALSFALYSRFRDSFNDSLEEWEKYCQAIASSKFLMGDRVMGNGRAFKLSLVWSLGLRTIADVRCGKYDRDRTIPRTAEQAVVDQESAIDEIQNSAEELWAINLRKKFLEKLGAPAYKSWFKELKIKRKNDTIYFIASSGFQSSYINSKYYQTIEKIVESVGVAAKICICDVTAFQLKAVSTNARFANRA